MLEQFKESDNYINLTEDGGVKKKLISEGTGIQASPNKEVIIKYTSKYNNKIYDESNTPPIVSQPEKMKLLKV